MLHILQCMNTIKALWSGYDITLNVQTWSTWSEEVVKHDMRLLPESMATYHTTAQVAADMDGWSYKARSTVPTLIWHYKQFEKKLYKKGMCEVSLVVVAHIN